MVRQVAEQNGLQAHHCQNFRKGPMKNIKIKQRTAMETL